MIVRRLAEIVNTDRDVRAKTGAWASRRFLLKDDNMGFSFHDTTIYGGTTTLIWYKNHLEAVYCVSGSGKLEVIETGEVYEISDGTMYALNEHEKHYLTAYTDMRLICVFNPPLTGREVHDKDGVYPADEESGK